MFTLVSRAPQKFPFLGVSPASIHTVSLCYSLRSCTDMVSDPTIALPPASVANLYSTIAGATVDPSNPNRYIVPCTSKIQITMTFGGTNFTMDPRDAMTNESGTCFGTVEATGGSVIMIGSPLMRNVYTYVIRSSILLRGSACEYSTFAAAFDTMPPTLTVGFANLAKQSPSHTPTSRYLSSLDYRL